MNSFFSFLYPNHPARNILLAGMVLLLSLKAFAQHPDKQITLQLNNCSLEEFVQSVERQTGITFIYGEEVQLSHPIQIQTRQLSLRNVLDEAFRNQPISYRIERGHILLSKKKLPNTPRKHYTLNGYVTDRQSAETLIGVNILSGSAGTTTNTFGYYTLTLPEGTHTVSFSYMGYHTHHTTLTLYKDSLLNIKLETDNHILREIVITDRQEAGVQSTGTGSHVIPQTQIKQTPVVLGETDILKTIQLMPGVQAGNEGFSGLCVRGGTPDQNLVLLDGVPVYNADHVLGLFSIFTPEAVKKVTLYKGSYPARYNGRLSSIVDIRTNDGDMHHYHGSLTVGMPITKFHLEGPIRKGKTAFSLTGRGFYAYYYGFFDLNAKVNHKFSDRSRLFLNLYNGGDRLKYNYTDRSDHLEDDLLSQTNCQGKEKMNWGNFIGSLRWNYVFTPKLFANVTLAYNRYGMRITHEEKDYEVRNYEPFSTYSFKQNYQSGITDLSGRLDFDFTPNPRHHIKFGGEYIRHHFRPETNNIKIHEEQEQTIRKDTLYQSSANSRLNGHEISLYAEDRIDIGKHWSTNTGVNLALFHTQGKSYVSLQPRISLRYKPSDEWAVKTSYTMIDQYVHLLTSTPLALPTDLWVPITRNIKPMNAHQISIGTVYTGWKGWELSLEGYWKQMNHVLEYKDGVSTLGAASLWEEKVEAGKGRSFGIELLMQRTVGRTTGWLSYTLSKADRQFKDGTINNGKRYPFKYDRRHSLSVCLNHHFSSRLSLAATWVFQTGGTLSVPEQRTTVLLPDGSQEAASFIRSRNNFRLPCSHRLNVSLNCTKKLKGRGTRIWSFGIYNVYNAMSPNLVYATQAGQDRLSFSNDNTIYSTDPRKIILKKVTLLPFIPSISYTYKF